MMSVQNGTPWLAMGAALVNFLSLANERLVQTQQLPLALNYTSFPSFKDLLSQIGKFHYWWMTLVGLAIAVGVGVARYLFVRLRRFVKEFRTELQRVDDDVAALQRSNSANKAEQPDSETLKSDPLLAIRDKLKKLEARMEEIDDPETGLRAKVNVVEEKLKNWKPPASDSEAYFSVELPDKAIIDEIVPEPNAIKPPSHISIEQMLAWAGEAGLVVKPVKATLGLFGNFSPSNEGDNWLAENKKSTEASYLFPRSERFEIATHYDMYRDSYDCAQPAAGRIVIVSPATVKLDSAQGGWKLSTKGELSVIP
jgi:hypothetical protein